MEFEFGDVGFCGGRKTGEPGEKSSRQGEETHMGSGWGGFFFHIFISIQAYIIPKDKAKN